MARVKVAVTETYLTGDHGGPVDGIYAECRKCLHVEESYGTGDGSVKRCLVLMRENCPRGLNNFYVKD